MTASLRNTTLKCSQNQSADELTEILGRLLPEKREAIMNFAQQLEYRGEQRGYQKALQASHADVWHAAQEDAEKESKLKTARKMLDAGSPIDFVKLVTDLKEEDLAALSDLDE